MKATRWLLISALISATAAVWSCTGEQAARGTGQEVERLRGASSYTPYDALSMFWSRQADGNEMVWVSSGAEAGRLLVSTASPQRRPDWVLSTQGVVAGLAARGEDVVIIATVYVSDDAILPVFRTPRGSLDGSRSLYIPRSSIEFAFDRLLEREGVPRDRVTSPQVETVGFTTIASLLAKPADSKDALDWALLVDPFLTNLVNEHPNRYEVGEGGLYEIHYSVVVRREDLNARRPAFVRLLEELHAADQTLSTLSDEQFYGELWGRMKNGQPERLSRMLTYDRKPAHLQLQLSTVRQRLREELQYLTNKYPNDLRMPSDIEVLVDPTLLKEVDSTRVIIR